MLNCSCVMVISIDPMWDNGNALNMESPVCKPQTLERFIVEKSLSCVLLVSWLVSGAMATSSSCKCLCLRHILMLSMVFSFCTNCCSLSHLTKYLWKKSKVWLSNPTTDILSYLPRLYVSPSKYQPNIVNRSSELLKKNTLSVFESPEILPVRRALSHKLRDIERGE